MAENEAEEGGKGGLIKKILIFGGGGLVLIIIGLGVGYLVFGSAQPDPSEQIEEIIERKMQEKEDAAANEDNGSPQKQSKDAPEEEVFATIYHEFPGTFTTNLQGSRKMLQIGVGVSTQYDDTVMVNVESHQLALRSVILGVISEFTEEDVKGQVGRDALAAGLRVGINETLEALEGFGGVEEVHFTSFVLQ
ncbi:flagellar basal body-associated FliL family protein [Alphaproteobacteria bacterium]|jgi:flagellar FliL protein|nr:flagellar basal body-associated FliL family protein [Alphaproteobacteria bacterium]